MLEKSFKNETHNNDGAGNGNFLCFEIHILSFLLSLGKQLLLTVLYLEFDRTFHGNNKYANTV
jgi:hypothetical protein